jgi:hypothetical protein
VSVDETFARFKTPESCEQFAINVQASAPERAREAVQLRAEKHGAKTDAEREALEAVYAYERALLQIRGKTVRASRTCQMIARRRIIPAVERVVARAAESQGYQALAEMGNAGHGVRGGCCTASDCLQ